MLAVLTHATESFSGVVGDQRPETAEETGAQGTWPSRYSTTSGLEDECRVEGGQDEEGVDGGGEEAEVEEDRVCWDRS